LGVESLHQTLCSPFEYLPCGTWVSRWV
jgi:hypothetical protein